jgi:hypothetical protein
METPKDYIDDDLREFIHHRDKGICQLCNKEGNWIRFGSRYFACLKQLKRGQSYHFTKNPQRIWTKFHIDHIIPEIMGGSTQEKNLRLLCPKCNLSRKKDEMV